RDAVFEGRDGGRPLGVGGFEGRDAVAQGDLVTTEEDDELAKVRDVAPVALDSAAQASRVAARNDHSATAGRLESREAVAEELGDPVEGRDLVGVLAGKGVRLVREAVGLVRAGGGGVGLRLRRVDGDALRGDLVLEVT